MGEHAHDCERCFDECPECSPFGVDAVFAGLRRESREESAAEITAWSGDDPAEVMGSDWGAIWGGSRLDRRLRYLPA